MGDTRQTGGIILTQGQIKRCHICHGKGIENIITRMTFGKDPELDQMQIECRECAGEGKIYVCPASLAGTTYSG